MTNEDDTDEILNAAVHADRHPYPIKRANPFPTRNPENFIDPLMGLRPNIPLDQMLEDADTDQG